LPSSQPEARFRDIAQSIALIKGYIEQAGGVRQAIMDNNLTKDAIERRLLIVSEAAIKLGDLAEDMEPDQDWSGVRGLGNILRHQ